MFGICRWKEPLAHDSAVQGTKLIHRAPSVAVIMATLFDGTSAEDGSLDHGGGGAAWTSLHEPDGG